MVYDSRPETWAHISKVRRYIGDCVANLAGRADAHDKSKLWPPELAVFDEYTPRLAGVEYGTDEYRACLEGMGPALEHHYAANAHHPEHWADGIAGMSLLDLVEMVCDWKAAGERHGDSSVAQSIAVNQARFGYGDELKGILLNTARELGMA